MTELDDKVFCSFGEWLLAVKKARQTGIVDERLETIIPFRMLHNTDLERWRARTFWHKEPETIAWINTFESGEVFFDVGANIGIYSLYCAFKHPDMIIYAFEPAVANFQSLQENISLNGFENVFAHCTAVGEVNGPVKFFAPTEKAGDSGGQVSRHGETIPAITLDSLPSSPDHVKIDIDGQEAKVVIGMMKALHTVKSVLVEVTDSSKGVITRLMEIYGLTSDNKFNTMTPHSRDRRKVEEIPEENIIFTRKA